MEDLTAAVAGVVRGPIRPSAQTEVVVETRAATALRGVAHLPEASALREAVHQDGRMVTSEALLQGLRVLQGLLEAQEEDERVEEVDSSSQKNPLT